MGLLSDAAAIKLGSTDVAAVYVGATQVWPAAGPPAGYDSFVLESSTPTWTSTPWWNQPAKFGVAIVANAGILVHGVRWWRLNDYATSLPVLHMSAAAEGWSLDVATADAATSWGTAGWETILFDDPVAMDENDTTILWIATTTEVDKVVNSSYFSTPVDSIGGLFTSFDPAGWYNLPTTALPNEAPYNSTAAEWHGIDPLVTAV